jgi:hypothetical protein
MDFTFIGVAFRVQCVGLNASAAARGRSLDSPANCKRFQIYSLAESLATMGFFTPHMLRSAPNRGWMPKTFTAFPTLDYPECKRLQGSALTVK